MPKMSLALNSQCATRALKHLSALIADLKLTRRSVSVLLIFILLVQVFTIGSVQRTQANSKAPMASVPISAPPQPFTTTQSGGMPDVVSLAAMILPNLSTMLAEPELPASFVPPADPAFSQRFVAGVASLFGLIRTRTKAAALTNATVPKPFAVAGAVKFDFDGDGRADISRWRPANHEFRIKKSSDGTFMSITTLGSSTSVIAPGDFDGDEITDPAVVDGGNWTYIGSQNQTTYTIALGQTGIPMAGDYNGDGVTDAAVFQPSSGDWYVRYSGSSTTEPPHHFGQAGDIPIQGDFDGDGKSDLTVYRPSLGAWYVATSSSAYDDYLEPQVWGNYADQPTPADYNGDGITDYSVWRPTSGAWHTLESIPFETEAKPVYATQNLGSNGDTAVTSAYTKQIGGTVTGYEMAGVRLDAKNATGGTNLYSQNFSWSTSLVNLPGRSGMNAGFGIGYNSLVWAKVGSAMYFDPDNSNVSPGFRFGFPVIEPVYYDSGKGRWAYLMVTPGGARVDFRQLGASGTFETADSSYTRLVANVPGNPFAPINSPVEDIEITVTTTDGTQVKYNWKGGAFRCN